MGPSKETPGTPSAFILKLSYGEGVGEEVAVFNSAEKFQWWLALYREKEMAPKQVILQVRMSTGRSNMHRFPTVKELKRWVKTEFGEE